MIPGGMRLMTGHPAILRPVQRNNYWTVGCVSILHSQRCYKEDTLRQTAGASCLSRGFNGHLIKGVAMLMETNFV